MKVLIVLRDTDHPDIHRTSAHEDVHIGAYFMSLTGYAYDVVVAAPSNQQERRYVNEVLRPLLNPNGKLIIM